MSDEKNLTPKRWLPDASWLAVGLVLTVVLAALAYYVMNRPSVPVVPVQPTGTVPVGTDSDVPDSDGEVSEFVRSDSEDELKTWIAEGPETTAYYGGKMMRTMVMESMAVDAAPAPMADTATGIGMGGESQADRYSSTNVQVAGIDEPDRVKTDGKSIFYAPEQRYWPVFRSALAPKVMPETDVVDSIGIMPPQPRQPDGAVVVGAFPVEDLELLGRLDRSGDLLLSGNVLMVFDYDGVYAYDVTDRAKPASVWSYTYDEGHSLVTARLQDGKLYLVTRTYLNRSKPCPVQPLAAEAGGVIIPCDQVWHRAEPSEADTAFAVVAVSPADGSVAGSTAFIGSGNTTTVAMFPGSLYVATGLSVDTLEFFVGFLNENADMVPADVLSRLNRVAGYDLSLSAKQAELSVVLERWMSGLSDDDRLLLENEMTNRGTDYWRKHAREVGGTGIMKIGLPNLEMSATGRVPGSLLNQFSLDEYEGKLRVAVTVGGGVNPIVWQVDDSVSDVYVLDESLGIIGSAQGMGEGERIYSVRFIGKRGYVVTFRETDPFYVLDLSNPTAPVVSGELKIPGYSSYLHPLEENLILGVGKEGSQVKLSLFDVKDAANPTEVAKYSLDEYWSDVLGTHHAFLQDAKHRVFFMPGSKGGYVFSYLPDSLRIERAVSGAGVSRALYISDNLYLISDSEIIVLDENDWREVGKLKLQ